MQAGALVYNTTIPKNIDNNFLVVDGGTTTRGNYYFSPTAIQNGHYCQIVAGSGQTTANLETFAALAASGTQLVNIPPAITSIVPSNGTSAGGTTVVLAGYAMSGCTACTFGITPAASFTQISANVVTCVSPPGSGLVNITIDTPYGTSPTAVVTQYTYWGDESHNPPPAPTLARPRLAVPPKGIDDGNHVPPVQPPRRHSASGMQ